MFNQRSLSVALLTSLLAFSSWTTQAQTQEPVRPPPPAGMERPGPGAGGDHRGGEARQLKHLFKVVDATEAQRESVKKIVMTAQQDTKPQQQAAHDLHREGMALLTAAKLDPAAIEANRQKSMALQETLSKGRTQMRIDIANVFSPEQRAKYAAWMQAHSGKEGRHRD